MRLATTRASPPTSASTCSLTSPSLSLASSSRGATTKRRALPRSPQRLRRWVPPARTWRGPRKSGTQTRSRISRIQRTPTLGTISEEYNRLKALSLVVNGSRREGNEYQGYQNGRGVLKCRGLGRNALTCTQSCFILKCGLRENFPMRKITTQRFFLLDEQESDLRICVT